MRSAHDRKGQPIYSKTAKSAHYLPRTGSYSTVPHRNGRVDVLPPSAKVELYDAATQISDLSARLDALRLEREHLAARVFSLARVDKWRDRVGSRGSEGQKLATLTAEGDRIDAERRAIRKRIGALKSLLGGGPSPKLETVFLRLAEAELPGDVFAELHARAAAIVARARR